MKERNKKIGIGIATGLAGIVLGAVIEKAHLNSVLYQFGKPIAENVSETHVAILDIPDNPFLLLANEQTRDISYVPINQGVYGSEPARGIERIINSPSPINSIKATKEFIITGGNAENGYAITFQPIEINNNKISYKGIPHKIILPGSSGGIIEIIGEDELKEIIRNHPTRDYSQNQYIKLRDDKRLPEGTSARASYGADSRLIKRAGRIYYNPLKGPYAGIFNPEKTSGVIAITETGTYAVLLKDPQPKNEK